MKTASAAIKVGLTALLVAIIGYGSFKWVGKGLPSSAGFEVWALFRDATGLVEKSRIQIAGLVVGELRDRRLEGNFARISLRVKPGVKLWSNAAIYKRTASLLGEFYIEIDPGTPESPDPLTGKARANYPLEGCFERTHDAGCNQIRNVVEAVTTGDVLVQVSETLPVLRDILRDIQDLTSGPIRSITNEVASGISKNADTMAKLIGHTDAILRDVQRLTSDKGPVYEDLRKSVENVKDITESVKTLIGSGEGQMNSTGDKIKRNLDQLSTTLEKLNGAIDEATKMAESINRGEGTAGKLLKDDTIANAASDIMSEGADFVRSLTRMQTVVGIQEDYLLHAAAGKTTLSLRLQPRPDKYYYLEFIDDPRGSRTYTHQTQVTCAGSAASPTGQCAGGAGYLNTDTYTRTSAFRISVMFARRVGNEKAGITGRLGIKESTGGGGADIDFWKQRIVLSLDLFDFLSEQLPRLKIQAALQLGVIHPILRHVWITGGIDDVLNNPTDANTAAGPTTGGSMTGSAGLPITTCGPGTPSSWCVGGRDVFFGAKLFFTDDDLRALLTVGGSAIAGGTK